MKKINLELEIEDNQEISIKINVKDNKIEIKENPTKEQKEEVVKWIFENFPKYKVTLPPKGIEVYEKVLDKIIDDFSKGYVK